MLRVPKTVVERLSAQLRRTCLRWPVIKAGIGQAIAEWKLRAVLLVDIPRDKLVRAFPGRFGEVGIASGAARVQSVVIERLLTDGSRPSYGKLSTRIRFTKQSAHESGAGLHSGKPGCENRRDVFKRPGKREWPPAKQNKDGRFSRGDNRFQEFLLAAWQAEVRARCGFSSHLRGVFTQSKNYGVRFLRGFDRFSQLLVRSFDYFAPLCVPQVIDAQPLTKRRTQCDHVFGTALRRPRSEHDRGIIRQWTNERDGLPVTGKRK